MDKDDNTKATATAMSSKDAMDLSMWGRRGWVCPRCDNVMSPEMPYCIFCAKGSNNAVVQTIPNPSYPNNVTSTGYHVKEGTTITISN